VRNSTDRTIARRIERSLGLLLTKGRAVGVSVVAALQDPGEDLIPYRNLFPTRVALRLDGGGGHGARGRRGIGARGRTTFLSRFRRMHAFTQLTFASGLAYTP